MAYALVITIFAGLSLLALLAGVTYWGRRAAGGNLSLRGWRWQPNALGFTLLAIVVAVVLWRIFPAFLFLPLVVPFFWRFRGRRSGGPFVWQWRARRGQPHTNGHSNGHNQGDDPAIEGQYKNIDEE